MQIPNKVRISDAPSSPSRKGERPHQRMISGKNYAGNFERAANEYSYFSRSDQGSDETVTDYADDWASNTIVGLPLELADQWTPFLDRQTALSQDDVVVEEKLFKIRLAENSHCKNAASTLIRKMYAWRGYETEGMQSSQPNRVTLVASADDVTVATITIGFDSPNGLLVDELYDGETDSLRKSGRRLCEFTKLAIDHSIRSKRVLASLFHIAYQYAREIYNYTDLLIEVNPRHVRFYEKMLGFKQFGPRRLNPRVNATAVLLRLEFDHAQEQIAIHGGQADFSKTKKSLYPYFFSPEEEANICNRLVQLSNQCSFARSLS
ncbi:MAG: hypothetical protein V4568_00885 [Pseudomonadota bacterium]